MSTQNERFLVSVSLKNKAQPVMAHIDIIIPVKLDII